MENKTNIKFYKSMKNIIGVPIKLIFKPVVTGEENIPVKPYILVGNHKSFWDVPLVALYIEDNIHYMAKKELFKNKLLKFIFESLGAYPINREGIDVSAIKETIKLLNSNNTICIFPEGTRNKTENIILPFKSGITKIAKKTNSLILPFGISGDYKHNGNLKIKFGEPIDLNKMDINDEYLEYSVKRLIKMK